MNAPAPERSAQAPHWTRHVITDARGGVGSTMFQHVDYIELLDGPSGRAISDLLHLPAAGAVFSQVVSTGHEIGLEEHRASTLLFPLSGHLFCAIGPQDLAVRPGEALFLPPGRRRTRTLRDRDTPFRAIVLSLPASGRFPRPGEARVFALADAPDLAAAARILGTLCAPETDAVGAQHVVLAARTLVEGAFSALVPDRKPETAALAPGHALRRAETLMRERFADEITIAGIAREAGISLRQLQDLFRRTHGLSPHGYLTRLRLEQAHLHLKGALPAPSVTEAALLAGFSHLGRFPRTYRDRFGLLPSDARGARR
jgi:AraC-like DNA-binding protein